MYSDYCKNRSSSETLVNETTESQAFFKGIQRNLAHALDLNAYLLKPVQRITKYQLLLKVGRSGITWTLDYSGHLELHLVVVYHFKLYLIIAIGSQFGLELE